MFVGFIGKVYRRFPFPEKEEDFKQKADGRQNRSVVEEIIQEFAQPIEIKVTVAADNGMIEIGSYGFSRASFHKMINYVWRGGYPRWKDEIRPESALSMKIILSHEPPGIFDGIRLAD